MTEKCEICRFSCKSEEKVEDCKFYPQEHQLGHTAHFKDDRNARHEASSKMCVVCKGYFGYKNIRWIKQEEGLYPLCVECRKTHDFITNTVERVNVA